MKALPTCVIRFLPEERVHDKQKLLEDAKAVVEKRQVLRRSLGLIKRKTEFDIDPCTHHDKLMEVASSVSHQ